MSAVRVPPVLAGSAPGGVPDAQHAGERDDDVHWAEQHAHRWAEVGDEHERSFDREDCGGDPDDPPHMCAFGGV